MAQHFPDIMGEYIEGSKRYETDGVQYAGHFDPPTMAPEQVVNLYVFFQNALNAPVTIELKIDLPKTGGFFGGGKPILRAGRSLIKIEMGEGEAGLLTLPFTTTEHAEAGKYAVTLEPKVSPKGKAQRIRPAKSRSKLGQGPIDNPVGLNLVGTLGATYVENSVKKAEFPLTIAGEPQPLERAPKLQHAYQTIWVKEQLKFFSQALHEISLRDAKLKEQLNVEALYVTLYNESTFRFADAGLPLRIGEAITLGKILTHSCQFFLSNPQRRQGLLAPIWESALVEGYETDNPLQVLRLSGYMHILKLSIAISFHLIGQALGRQPWSLEERQAVAEHIAENIEVGNTIDEDFLYLPLLMGGTLVSSRLTLDGENPQESLALMRQAREARKDLFFDDEMSQADKIYNQILKQTGQSLK